MGSYTSTVIEVVEVVKVVADTLQKLSDEIAHEQVEAVLEAPVVLDTTPTKRDPNDGNDEAITRCFDTIFQYGKNHTENSFYNAFGYTFAGADSQPRELDRGAPNSVEGLQDVVVYCSAENSLGKYLTGTLGKDSTLKDGDLQDKLTPMIQAFYQKRNTDWEQYNTSFTWIHTPVTGGKIPKRLDFNCEYANCVENDQVVLVMVFSAVWYTFVDELFKADK